MCPGLSLPGRATGARTPPLPAQWPPPAQPQALAIAIAAHQGAVVEAERQVPALPLPSPLRSEGADARLAPLEKGKSFDGGDGSKCVDHQSKFRMSPGAVQPRCDRVLGCSLNRAVR